MRILKIEKHEFDDFLVPAIGQTSAKDLQELEVGLRVIRKLNSISTSEVLERQPTVRMVPLRKMTTHEAYLLLEDDEYQLILDRVESYIPKVTLLAVEELYAFVERIIQAPETTAEEMPRLTTEG